MVEDIEKGCDVRLLWGSQLLNSLATYHIMQVVLNRAAAGCKKIMTYEKKDTTDNERPARIEKPQNTLVESMPIFEFARIYYDGP